MQAISIAFSKINVLVICENESLNDRLKGVLTGLGVSEHMITECGSWKDGQSKDLEVFDLILMDCAFDRFSCELVLDDLGRVLEDGLSTPVVLVADEGARVSIEYILGDRDIAVIGNSLCPKTFYLKLHMLMGETRSISSKREVTPKGDIKDDRLGVYSPSSP